MENQNQNQRSDLESKAIGALAAMSNTPFKTAFKLTFGIGLARVALFLITASVLVGLYKIATM